MAQEGVDSTAIGSVPLCAFATGDLVDLMEDVDRDVFAGL